MNTKTLIAAAWITALPLGTASANTNDPEPLDWITGKNGCHVLLTEQECLKHGQTLAAMNSYPLRYAYLASQGIPLRERETLCRCTVSPSPGVTYRQRRPHLVKRS